MWFYYFTYSLICELSFLPYDRVCCATLLLGSRVLLAMYSSLPRMRALPVSVRHVVFFISFVVCAHARLAGLLTVRAL